MTLEEKVKAKNKQLLEEFPFIRPRSWYSGEPIDIDYTYTILDDMPTGWKMAFGEELCKELKEALVKAGQLDNYQVIQVKEKYGYLHWYDNGGEITRRILSKYEKISEATCCRCGKRATKMSLGWICPFCSDCAESLSKNGYMQFKDIEEVTQD